MAKRKDKKPNVPKRYTCIVKVGDNPNNTARCVKYRCDDLLKFLAFLNSDWTTWVWIKVYSNKGSNEGTQLGYYTKKNPPISARI